RDELSGRGELPRGLRDPLLAPEEVRAELTSSLRVEWWTRSPGETDGLPCDDWRDAEVVVPALTYAGRLRAFLDDTLELREQGRRVVVATLQSARLSELYDEHGAIVPAVDGLQDAPSRGSLTLVQGSLLEGWRVPALGLSVFSDAEIFGWSKPAPVARFKREAAATTGGLDFKPGDYVVHIEHGIGRFVGVEKRVAGGIEREYLELQYAGTDRLFVPTDQLDRVTRYVGMGEAAPALSRLGTAEWARAKARVKESVAAIARELVELYSFRQHAQGHPFAPDGRWQSEMEAAFPYVETIDQQRAIRDVKADMEAPRPMDRLVCGDVGYGKTEVALRAAFKAVLDGMQVAVLVPTTILAQQHFETFRARMEAFPTRVAVLSRFQSRAEQKAALAGLASGAIDIVIGTHRLLQKDVTFKKLGLLIIDEEQRFGVKHKEHLKKMRRSVDVLTLTATPIPRSLHMAMIGVRDMSVIETPPEGRLPIRTYLQPFDEYHIREAMLRELDRGGQVYFVHNAVQTIQAMAERLRRLVPEARVAIAHGQMPEDELERVMSAFAEGEDSVLVCSSIIENGLDLPNVNTMIVNDAANFGLAQLYQLRGRIGRGSVRAYAYLLYRRDQRITRTAERRLRAVFEASELGAGFKIAMQDLEIRGAGNLLGPEQSGNISTVGFDLYSKLLAHAIQERQGQATADEEGVALPVAVDLPLHMYIPSDYVAHDSPRLALYRRLAGVRDTAALDALDDEIRDRFGPLPQPVANLLFFVRVKVLAARAGLAAVALDETLLTLRGRDETLFDRLALYRRFGMDARVVRGVLRVPRSRLGADWQEVLLTLLEETIAANTPARPSARTALAAGQS
ncbi:MAG TPA: transcription-repair coupling factor, partial [Chloroflexota bacterium]|nr:transcription-repair coupling factor [Chloroflexota bacterium]